MDLKTLQTLFPCRAALRVPEFCDAFGISKDLFYSLVRKNQLKVLKIGSVTAVTLSEISAWSEARVGEKRRPADNRPRIARQMEGLCWRPQPVEGRCKNWKHGA